MTGGYDNLLKAVVELDESSLDQEKLENLEALLPTSSELQMVRTYKGEQMVVWWWSWW